MAKKKPKWVELTGFERVALSWALEQMIKNDLIHEPSARDLINKIDTAESIRIIPKEKKHD